MAMNPDEYRIDPRQPFRIKKAATLAPPLYESREDYARRLAGYVDEMDELQEKLYSSGSHAVLAVFQAMDAAGKDSTIRAVFSGINPQGCNVSSFRQPSPLEQAHDFLWRAAVQLPRRGMIGVFNRSYYEEVLTVRVHPEILAAQSIPGAPADDVVWRQRYRSIKDFEAHLSRNGTRIVKFFLNVSKDEQARRLRARIDTPRKNWKFDPNDVHERQFWPRYMDAYEQCLNATSTEHAPWYAIPADDKENMRLMVADILLQTLKKLNLAFPKVSDAQREEMKKLGALINETTPPSTATDSTQ